MELGSERVFRETTVARLASPEQLDQLIRVTRPVDWIGTLAIAVGVIALVIWSVIGQIPTRVAGEGILFSGSGNIFVAATAVSGRLASVDVAVGDKVVRGQVVAHVAQTEIEERYQAAREVLEERERERTELAAVIKRERDIKSANSAAQRNALEQVIAAAENRSAYLKDTVSGLDRLANQGFITRRELESRRAELATSDERLMEARNAIQRLQGTLREALSQRELDQLAADFKVNEARRQMEQLAATLNRNSMLLSPADGRVIEVKVSPGAVLAAGSPVVAVETEVESLSAIVYVPSALGKNIEPGMEVRVTPGTIRREEFGSMIGQVRTISEFPMSPEGMAAILHNDALVRRFSRDGAPYAVVVQLATDPTTYSGYSWSSGDGPRLRLTTGTLLRAEVTTRKQPPIDLVMPVMRRFAGIDG